MTTFRQLNVFLCHASQDKPAVRKLYVRLKSEPWIAPWSGWLLSYSVCTFFAPKLALLLSRAIEHLWGTTEVIQQQPCFKLS